MFSDLPGFIINPLSGNAPWFSILLCLTPDDFTRQVESAATHWVKKKKYVRHQKPTMLI
jgi:hypothetical protein